MGAGFLMTLVLAWYHGGRGRRHDALDWLSAAYDAGFRLHRLAELDPALDRLRDEPRFESWHSRIVADVNEMRARGRGGGGPGAVGPTPLPRGAVPA